MEDVRPTEALMRDLAWLKCLARALVRDENDANDLVQDTWLVAAEHAPTDGRPLKPWLSRVALNLVRMRSRSTKRRAAREAAVEPAAPATPSPDELVDRLRAQRVIADEVLRLAEPYRNTVLLHYFEDLSSAEIARRSGIPEGTVRRRLKVALDELRGRLHAEERKTGQAIVAVLAPLTVKQGAASAALGVVVLKKAIAIAVVVVGLILVGAHLYKKRTSAPAAATETRLGSGTRSVAAASDAKTARIAVAVSDSTGAIGDAWVRCAPTKGEVVIVKTARDGTASLDLPAGEWSIAASAEGHEPAATTLAVAAGHDDRVKLVLPAGGQTVTGIVTDMTGGVIAGARIDAARLGLEAKPGAAVAVTLSDRAGRYKLAVGGGAVLVAASHPDYASQVRYVDLGSSGATADFALVPGGVIEGVVRDVETNQPVAGATVRAEGESALELADANERAVTADAAGKFRFAGLGPGAYILFARAAARSSRVPVGVSVGVAEQHANIVVPIEAAATIRGKVVDDRGAPVANVSVVATGGGGDPGRAISDPAGAFVLAGLAPGRWVLRGTSDRYLADGQAIAPLEKSDVEGVVVRVRRGLDLRGHVEPREACEVEISVPGREDLPLGHDAMMTSADGEFHFAPLGPGNATLAAHCASGNQGSAIAALAPGGADTILALTPGGSIEGRVVDKAGKPVGGVIVSAESADEMTRIDNGAMVSGAKAMTSPDGVFVIGGLGAAGYRLAVLDTGRPMKPAKLVKLALSAGQHATGVEVVVERPTGTIRGIVTGPDGAAVADAWVAVHQTLADELEALSPSSENHQVTFRMAGGGTRAPPPAMTDARGQFELSSLPSGKYQVIAEAQGGELRGEAADVTTDARISIRLAGVSSLHGTVHGPRGPTELFTVAIDGHGGVDFDPADPKRTGGSFAGGTFEFSHLDPGDYAIDVDSADGTGKATVHISSGEAASVDIALVANGTVTGRVVDKTGKPVSGVGVALIPDQPPGKLQIALHEQPPTTGPDGRFQVQGPPGPRTLVILRAPPTAKRGVSVAPDTTLDVGDVTLEEHP